jgi:hypothetical protein
MALAVRRLLEAALREFSPDWEIVGECSQVDLTDSTQWPSSSRSVQVALRHQATGAQKVLGRRTGGHAAASCHRGLAYLVLEAYGARNTDPIRRYFAEIGIAPPTSKQILSAINRLAAANPQQAGPPSQPWVAFIEQIRADQRGWLVIVQRHHPALYRHCQQALAALEKAQVIVDRRFGSRRRVNQPYPAERRRALTDRRSRRETQTELQTSALAFVRLT